MLLLNRFGDNNVLWHLNINRLFIYNSYCLLNCHNWLFYFIKSDIDEENSTSKGIVGEVDLVAAAAESVEEAEEGVVSLDSGQGEARRNLFGERLANNHIDVSHGLKVSGILEDRRKIDVELGVLDLVLVALVLADNDLVLELSPAESDLKDKDILSLANPAHALQLSSPREGAKGLPNEGKDLVLFVIGELISLGYNDWFLDRDDRLLHNDNSL